MAFTNVGSAENQVSGASISDDDPISFSVTVPDLGANSIGWVQISAHAVAGTSTINAVTWDGQAMTHAIPASLSIPSYSSHIFYLVNPPDNASKTIAITFSEPTGTPVTASLHIVVGWADAGAAVTLDDTSEGSGTTQNPTIISTQAGANELVISNSASSANAVGSPVTTDCTELQNWDSGGNCSIAAYSIPAGSGDATHQHNYSQSGTYGIVSASFKEASGGITQAIGLTTETDTAQTMAGAKSKALGLNTETDSAQGITAIKVATIGLVSETESAQAMSAAKVVVLGIATETDSALGITAPGGIVLEIGIASETGAAFAMTALKVAALGLASEVDAAQAITAAKVKALGITSETDSAQALAIGKAYPLGIIAETDAALAVAIFKAMALGIATETDSALALVSLGAHQHNIGFSTATDGTARGRAVAGDN